MKGIHLEGLRVLGKPQRFARFYYENGADELIYMDVVASLYGRNSLLDMIRQTSREIFIPLTVGGGLRSLDDIQSALRAGADKVSLNTAVVNRPELVREAARRFGSSAIVVSIEAYRSPDGCYTAYTDNGREKTSLDVLEWAQHVTDLGAGELLLTSINREGTGTGFDLELVQLVADMVSIPVIACGGAGTPEHVVDAVATGHADAVCIASMFHYDFIRAFAFDDEFAAEGNTDFLNSNRDWKRVTPTSIGEIKSFVQHHQVDVRHNEQEIA